jgi:hypothetical protein
VSDRVRWVVVTRAWRVLGSGIEGRPPAMEVSCEYTEEAAADRRQGGGPPVWGLGVGLTTLYLKK